ncbi:MAG: hypothetical protein DMF51_07165 [Acidobacteria bacterium]|nr:MAG: hypothetical protein DMF51_07165 [Acidobacteriota bacterium]
MGGKAIAPSPAAARLRLPGRPLYLNMALGAYGSVTPTPASRPGALHDPVWSDPTASSAASSALRPDPRVRRPGCGRARSDRSGSGAWPPETFARQDALFVVGVLGNESFSVVLDQVVRGKAINGHPFDVRRLRSPEEAAACQMVFVGAQETRLLPALFKAVRATAVLTVGDGESFTRQGGIMNFVVRDNRVRFEVNTDAAGRAGLSISSKLLQLATIVRDVRPAEDSR